MLRNRRNEASFERTGYYNNVLSAENDEIACATYEHLFGEKPIKILQMKNLNESLKELRARFCYSDAQIFLSTMSATASLQIREKNMCFFMSLK